MRRVPRTNPVQRISQWRSDEEYQLGREEEAAAYYEEKWAAEKAAKAAEGVK